MIYHCIDSAAKTILARSIVIAKHPPILCWLCGSRLVELITSKLADGYLVCNYACACGHNFTERYRYATQIQADPIEVSINDPYCSSSSIDYLKRIIKEINLYDKARHQMALKSDYWL